MAHQQELPDIPIKYIPYDALHEIALVFDSPSVDGQRTLEGLAEKIFELSGYKIKVDHIKVRGLKTRCNAGQSPTVEFLQDLSKHKKANLQILQRAIVSLETSVDDVLPNYLPAIIKRYNAEIKQTMCSSKCSQHACNCNGCSVTGSGRSFSFPSREPNHNDRTGHPRRCAMGGCAHNHQAMPKQRRRNMNDLHNGQGLPCHYNITEDSCSDNLTMKSNFQNSSVMSEPDFDQSQTFSMQLYRNDNYISPPEDFHPTPPSDLEDEDEESIGADGGSICGRRSVGRSRSEEYFEAEHVSAQRRVKTEPTFDESSSESSDNSRRHSHPIYERSQPKRKDCESDGDIPNIHDECTCFRTPRINIGPKMVFVSLADDSKHHIKEVLIMCEKFKQKGFEVKCDMMESLFTEQNINVNEWLDQCFKRACFVIFCISPKYYKHIRAENTSEAHPSDNRFHTRYIFDRARSEFIENNSMNKRFLPVLFRNSSASFTHIPEFLRSTIRYVFPDTFGHLTEFMQQSWERQQQCSVPH